MENRDDYKSRQRKRAESFVHQIAKKEKMKIRIRREGDETIWFGLGVFGVVGWSVAIPTLIGVALGLWIDKTWPSQYSWTLTLLIGGVMLGSLNAWYWVKKAGIRKSEEEEEE
ncbi:MAG TPA: AtpZ/AtpI family protein [Syntrophales bacterium]|nr:AtpZ/AtpI family protein [Syntrophales bacterium]HOL59384.1 AtpZ/AtpI family protein [Syntrophales bacterium]HPO35541.1 AtpZ/AtpI family protein [Syntrophales bacterium]